METPTVVTTQVVIDHFKGDSAWHGKWLLVFERNIATFEKKVKRVWEAIGSEDASAVLAAIKCWTSARGKPQGLVIDKARRAAGWAAIGTVGRAARRGVGHQRRRRVPAR
jgi:hypothetical protein